MTVALTGFMACGKSTFGRAAAELLGWSFIDLDREIEKAHGTVADIFSRGGESLFRELESRTLESVLSGYSGIGCIIALGGGTVLSDINMEILRSSGVFIIWLDTAFGIILSELSNAERPLVKEKTTDEIRTLYDLRRSRYESCADATVRIDSTDYESAIKRIAELASNR